MSIDAQLAREFFELSGFRVHTRWSQAPRAEGSAQLYVEHPASGAIDDRGLVLTPDSVRGIRRALVEVRAWHSDRLYASVVESNPILTLFAKPENALHAQDFFGGEPFATILVASELPSNVDQRAKAIGALEASPVDHVVEFPVLLRTLIADVGVNGNYAASATLQLVQLLKRYRLIEHQQMEFHFPFEAPAAAAPVVDATPAESTDDARYEEDEWE